jgi:hypothetical protein
MLRSFTIKNFRCFKDLTVEPLERVNLIAGKNSVGKTAFLEALFLHAGPDKPDLPLNVNLIRGLQLLTLDAVDVWSWMFFEKKISESIELTSLRGENVRAFLKIRLVESKKSRLDISANAEHLRPVGPLTTLAGPRDLVLEYEDTGRRGNLRAYITSDGKVEYERDGLAPSLPSVFLGTWPHGLGSDTKSFSKLEEVGRQDEVVKALKHLEPRLRHLAILTLGSAPMIHGDVGAGRLIPLPLIGEGIVRLLSILLAIVSVPKGIVLIDEIEDGLHYSVMVDVWRAIAEAAHQSDTQIFATTHSWECIWNAHRAFMESEMYDFRLHRLDRIDDEISVVTYDREKLETSIAMGLEVR